ncbi:hypothetical protein EMPS_00971 [Entomortierella parvispora]|uniref:Cytochrome P450 n=1 Tax=Entomortierella parvispora TaxID=205924 RepID=A0A9P3H203_9FUNG|nr:hypothetical protein EMPS_00971 [Entomortierella parvispora]
MSLLHIVSFAKQGLARYLSRVDTTLLENLMFGLLLFVLFLVIKYPNRAIGCRSRPDLKGPREWPVLGYLPIAMCESGQQSLDNLLKMFEKYDNVFTITIPGFTRVVFVNSVEAVEHVYKTKFSSYEKGEMVRNNLRDIFGDGIFLADHESWRFHRKTAVNIFTTRLYRQLSQGAFKDSAVQLCGIFDRFSARGKPVDLQQFFLRLTMDVFGHMTFGVDFKALSACEERSEFGDAFDYLTSSIDNRSSNPFWRWTDQFVPGRTQDLKNALGTINRYAYSAIGARRNEISAKAARAEDETGQDQQQESRPHDLLDQFITHVRDDGSMLTDLELRDVFVNFMIAGRDTTALTLSWMFYHVIADNRILKNALREIDAVLGSNAEVAASGVERKYLYETMMNELPYMKAIFHETLRLYPQVPKNGKFAMEDDVLPDGTVIDKGDMVSHSDYCMGRNRAIWGEDAEVFSPERWLIDVKDTRDSVNGIPKSPFGKIKVESPHKFHSFNSGPRLCLGQTFATVEAMVTSCIIIQNYDLKLVPNRPKPEVRPSVVSPMLRPLLVYATKKSDSPLPTAPHSNAVAL